MCAMSWRKKGWGLDQFKKEIIKGNGVTVSSLRKLESLSVMLSYNPNSCPKLGRNVRRCNRDEGENVNEKCEKWT